MKIEQEIMEMFDEKCKQVEFLHGVPVDLPHYYKEELKSFISHIITLVQKREREEIEECRPEYRKDNNKKITKII